MSQTVTDEGLILRTQSYQENDLLVSVYFAHYGKMNLLARGVRKPKSKNASSLLPGMISEFVFILKEGLSRLVKASPVRLFRYLDSHLEVMACAQLTMEYFYRSAPDRQPNAKHYAFICQVLERLDEGYPYLLVYFFCDCVYLERLRQRIDGGSLCFLSGFPSYCFHQCPGWWFCLSGTSAGNDDHLFQTYPAILSPDQQAGSLAHR